MGEQRTRLWLGIGTCVLLGGSPAAAETATPQTHAPAHALVAAAATGAAYSHGGGGGEGGEGGEGGGAMSVFGAGAGGEGGEGGEGGAGGEGGEGGEAGSAPPATESPGVFYSQLAFMLGHMHVGRELYQQGSGGIGGTHLGHPAAEHLPAVREALEQRDLARVIDRIEALAQAGSASTEWSDVESAWNAAREAIMDAMEDVDAGHREDAEFIGKVLRAILYQSRDEYDEAIRDGAFALEHEYHDSRGFMEVGRDLLDRKADVLKAADADAYEDVVARYEEVMEAWPGTQPPETPLVSVSELYGRIAAVEFALSRF